MDSGDQTAAVTVAPSGPAGVGRSSRRRRPSGRPPPVAASGAGHRGRWMTATVVLVALSVVVFIGELRRPAVAVTAVDDAIVRWLAGTGRARSVGDDDGARGSRVRG